MTDLESLYRGFAGPQSIFDEHLFKMLTREYAREITKEYVEFVDPALSERGNGLRQLIDKWLVTNDTSPSNTWEPIFGQLSLAVRGKSSVSAADCAVQLGLWLSVCRIQGLWEYRLETPNRLRWGHWLLPWSDHIQVESDGNEAIIKAGINGSTDKIKFQWLGSDWFSNEASSCLRSKMLNEHTVFLLQSALEQPEYQFLKDDVLEPGKWPEVPGKYQDAVQLLQDFSPEYLPWIDRVMRYVIPLSGKPGTIKSGSSRDEPGVSHISFDCTAAALAEMLVHEGTHQYFYLLTRLGPVDDGSDTKEYYSPIKRRGRPIHFILLAYHAFANVLLLYRSCLAAGFPDTDGYYTRAEAELIPQLKQLEEGLRATTALTPIGRALWEPLSEQLW